LCHLLEKGGGGMGIKHAKEDEVGKNSRTKFRRVYEGGIYHVTQRAPGMEILFVEDSDYVKFIRLLKVTTQKFNLNVYCFSLLANHLHLLFQVFV
jgi:REP element-mobilizing transposase RayT